MTEAVYMQHHYYPCFCIPQADPVDGYSPDFFWKQMQDTIYSFQFHIVSYFLKSTEKCSAQTYFSDQDIAKND